LDLNLDLEAGLCGHGPNLEGLPGGGKGTGSASTKERPPRARIRSKNCEDASAPPCQIGPEIVQAGSVLQRTAK
jgi:hypothetical protein